MENFGSYLKEHREKRGIRLEEIASITKIHLHSLELLEASRWEALPPEPFIRGFIIAYAKYVGLDSQEAVQRYTEEMVTNENIGSPTSIAPPSTPQFASSLPRLETKSHTAQAADKAARLEKAKPKAPREAMNMTGPRTLPWMKIGFGATAMVAVGLVVWIASVGKENTVATNTTPAGETAPALTVAAAGTTAVAPPATAANASGESVADLFARAGVKTDESRKPASPEVPALKAVTPVVPVVPVTPPKPATATNLVAPPPKPAAPVVAAPITAPKPEPVKTAETATGAEGHEIVVEGKARTWVKVVIDDEAPNEFFLPEGEKATYRAKSKIKVVLGNASGTRVLHNGTETPGKKVQGTIRYYIYPNTARFPQDPPKRVEASDSAATPETSSDSQN